MHTYLAYLRAISNVRGEVTKRMPLEGEREFFDQYVLKVHLKQSVYEHSTKINPRLSHVAVHRAGDAPLAHGEQRGMYVRLS